MEKWVAAGHRVDALVTTGDNVYEVGDPSLYHEYLDIPYAGLRKTRPMWPALGNHDIIGGHGAQEMAYLEMPMPPSIEELSGIQFLFLDSNHPDQAQSDWLEQQLSAEGPKFRVAVFHHPAFSCGKHGTTKNVNAMWVPIFERHQVAMVLNGHDHHYERFTIKGVSYVVTGGGGEDLYDLDQGCLDELNADASAKRHHFTALEVRANSITLTAVAEDGTVLDTAIIER